MIRGTQRRRCALPAGAEEDENEEGEEEEEEEEEEEKDELNEAETTHLAVERTLLSADKDRGEEAGEAATAGGQARAEKARADRLREEGEKEEGGAAVALRPFRCGRVSAHREFMHEVSLL